MSFEVLTRAVLQTFEALLADVFPLPPERRAHWSQPNQLTELAIGFEQGKYFIEWSAGKLVDGSDPSTTYIRAAYGRSVDVELELPRMPNAYADEYTNPEHALGFWQDAWQPLLERLHIVAGGFALLQLSRRGAASPIAFAADCVLRVRCDLEDARATLECSRLLELDEDEARFLGPALEELCENEGTRRWLQRLAASPGPLTVQAIGAIEDELPLS